MTNSELYQDIISRMNLTSKVVNGNIEISHEVSDWDTITLLAQRLDLVAGRWMQNQEPRTTVYLT